MVLRHRSAFILLLSLISVSSFAQSEKKLPPPPPGVVESPYEACKKVTVVEKKQYEKHKTAWKNWEESCDEIPLIADEAGFTKLTTLKNSAQYLTLASKVAENVAATLDKSEKFALCAAECFKGKASCEATKSGLSKKLQCSDVKKEVIAKMNEKSKEARLALGLSREASDLVSLNVRNVLSLDLTKRYNTNLSDFEAGTPNPVGRNALLIEERKQIEAILENEKKQVEAAYKKVLLEKKVKDTPELRTAWKSKVWMDRIDQREEENRLKYRQIIYEEMPLFSVVGAPKRFDKSKPVWSDDQIAKGFETLAKNAAQTKAAVKDSIQEGKLEFQRANGEAIKEWLLQLTSKKGQRNDLLYYMGMKNQVEEVLKKDPSLCAVASTLHSRLSSRELQNGGAILVGSFAGGPLTKGVSKGVTGIFRIGRALTGAEATGLTGLALGGVFLGDSFRFYETTENEITGGVKDVEHLSDARLNVALNLAFAPALGPSGWVLGKTLYRTLGDKMARDVPELSLLMKKAKTDPKKQEEIVDKWIGHKVASGIKNKILRKDDSELLKTEKGKNLLESLGSDIQKENPDFFKDPANFDLFLKAAASSVRSKPGDPKDLPEKARRLFLSIEPRAFNAWDPIARKGLLKVFDEGVEVLRTTYAKSPAVYAKFTSDKDAHEKIMLEALKRSGVIDDDTIQAMKMCALKK
jgi:hypothetical protein